VNPNKTMKKKIERALRTYVQAYLARSPLVTDEDRELMKLPLYDTTPHPVRAHKVTAVNPNTQNKERPHLVSGVAYAWRLRGADEPVSRAEDMPSGYPAYENSTGHRGPWSNITSLLISG
jgi:hypothetical protein